MKKLLAVVLVLLSTRVFAQTPRQCERYFQSASKEFNVPAPILEGLSYILTHWSQDVAGGSRGVMGLRSDWRFNHNLDSAAALIHLPVDSLLKDPYQNIRGAAAYLSDLRDQANRDSTVVTNDNLPSWWIVIARYSGIPQPGIAMEFAYHTLEELQLGVDRDGIVIPRYDINLSNFPDSVKATGFRKPADSLTPPVWVGSPNYSPRDGAPVVFVIIHDTEEQFDYAYSLFENPRVEAAANYIVRSQDGYIVQCVRDSDKAWAVRCWNPITVSIEHEGYETNPTFFTETQYEASARLTAHLCEKYSIPEDSLHIFGHGAWLYPWFNRIPFWRYTKYVGADYATCNTHTDPGKYWKWHHYFDLVHKYDTTRAVVFGSTPSSNSQNVQSSSSIVIDFSKPMEPVSTEAAFSITPAVKGRLSFNERQTRLTFQPDSPLRPSTTYTIRVGAAAEGSNLRPVMGPYVAKFTTGK